MNVDNLLQFAPAHYGNAPTVSEALWSYEREQLANAQTARDLSDVLYDAGDQLLDALKTGDAELIGRVVIAARNADLARRADRVVDIDPDDTPDVRPTPDMAALRVLLQASKERAEAQQ